MDINLNHLTVIPVPMFIGVNSSWNSSLLSFQKKIFMFLLITIYSILFFFLSYRRPDWAVMLLIFALPSYLIRFNIFGIPSTLLEIMLLIVFAVWFLKNYKFIFSNLKRKLKIDNCKLKIDNDYPFKWEIILLLIISFASVFVAGFSDNALGIWKAYFFEPLLFFIVLFNVLIKNSTPDNLKIINEKLLRFRNKFGMAAQGGENGIEIILWPLLFSALAVSVLAIYQKITGDLISNPFWAAAETRRAVSFFGYPNAVGLYLGPLILLFTGWFFSSLANYSFFHLPLTRRGVGGVSLSNKSCLNEILKIIAITLTIILSLLAIYFARSEGAIIGIIAALIIFGLLAGKLSRRVTASIMVVAMLLIFSSPTTRNYAISKITLTDFSGQVRRAQWAETWKMLSVGRVITGAGLDNYQNALAPYHADGFFYNDGADPDFHRKTVFNEEFRKTHWQPLEIYKYPHNIFLNFWSELGLAGMLLFIWILIKFYYLGIKNYLKIKKLKIKNSNEPYNYYLIIGLVGAITVIVIHGLVDVPYFKNDLAIMFWIFIAMIGMTDTNIQMHTNNTNNANSYGQRKADLS